MNLIEIKGLFEMDSCPETATYPAQVSRSAFLRARLAPARGIIGSVSEL